VTRRKRTAMERVAGLSDPEVVNLIDSGYPECITWRGALRPNGNLVRPHLGLFGNPARATLAHLHGVTRLPSAVRIKNTCGAFDCINPRHYAFSGPTTWLSRNLDVINCEDPVASRI